MLRWKSSLKPTSGGGSTGITLETSATTTGNSFSSPTSVDVNIPAVSTDDVLLLLVVTDGGSDPTSSPPSGWTKIVEQDGTAPSASTAAAYWKRASSGSTATTETWSSFFPSGEAYYIWVGAYSGCVSSVSPVDAYGSSTTGYGTPWSVNVTTNTSNAMIATISGSTNSTVTSTWSDGTELIDTAYPGTNATVSVNEKLESTAGSKTRTVTPSVTTGNSMVAVALRDTAPTPLQTRTVTFSSTDLNTFTIDSDSGQTIWNDEIFGLAGVGSGLRLWNGSESGNSGATYNSSNKRWSFSSSGDCTTWWENYYIRVKQDPGTGTFSDWINLTDAAGDIYTSCQPAYNNIGSAVVNYSGPGTWTTHAAGFRYQVEIYSDSNRP